MPYFYSLIVEIDLRSMAQATAARVAEDTAALPRECLVRLIVGDPATTREFVAWLRAREQLVWLDADAAEVVAHESVLTNINVCTVRGVLDPRLRGLLTAAFDRNVVLVTDPHDEELGSATWRSDALFWVRPASFTASAVGVWRNAAGAIVADLRDASPWPHDDGGPGGRIPWAFAAPASEGVRRTYWLGGSQAWGASVTQWEGLAALGFDEDDDEFRAWVETAARNRKREEARFDRFPVYVWTPPTWSGANTPTMKAQDALVIAAAWMLAGTEEHLRHLLETLGLDGSGLCDECSSASLHKVAEFIVAAVKVAALSKATLQAKLRVTRALRRLGHPEAERAAAFLRRARPELTAALPTKRSDFKRRRGEWKENLQPQLVDALCVACGQSKEPPSCAPIGS
jgi:hypothetical protein